MRNAGTRLTVERLEWNHFTCETVSPVYYSPAKQETTRPGGMREAIKDKLEASIHSFAPLA
jgi:hypothetical protein